MSGVFTQSEVHLFVHEFDYQNGTAYLTLRFESPTGAYTAGQKISVNAILALPEFSNQDNKIHLLYFPNSLTTTEYEKWIKLETFGKMVSEENSSESTLDFMPSKMFMNLGNFPPTGDTDVVWTQDGPKNVILQMDAKNVYGAEKDIEAHGIIIENIITIQPSDVKVQMQSNNITTGLALIITAVTILTGSVSFEKISTVKNDTKGKK